MTASGPLVRIARAGFALLVVAAMVAQFVHSTATVPTFSRVNFFSFFTNLSNMIAASVFLVGAARPDVRADWWRGLAVTCMAIVGVVFFALLREADVIVLPWVNTVLHLAMPIAVVADWLLVAPVARITRVRAAGWLGFPLLYVVYTLVRGNTIGWYPYPFLDPRTVGAAGVAGYVAGIVVVYALTIVAVAARANRGSPA